jgi:hypothetical protein
LPDNLVGKDYLEIITFNDKTVRPSYGFKNFKDMLNRTHYKRLSDAESTVLAKDLLITNTTIEVVNGSALSIPNREFNLPGVIEINGERIEYFVKNGNILSQLRRGTLGTGSLSKYSAGTLVTDVGLTQSVPYSDVEEKKVYFGDGSNKIFNLDYVPYLNSSSVSTGNTWYRVSNSIPNDYGQGDNIEVFVAGKRLRKAPISVYDQNLGQDSYLLKADKQYEAEFSVKQDTAHVRLTTPPAAGEMVVIVRKQGRIWQNPDESQALVFSNTDVATFLTARTVSLPK